MENITFRKELNFLTGRGYRNRDPLFVVISDDGRLSDYTDLFHIMTSRGLLATTVLNGSSIGALNRMSTENIQEMAAAGWDFQCHTYSHQILTSMTEEQIRTDMQQNNATFTSLGLSEPKYLAVPYGLIDDNARSVILEYRDAICRTNSIGIDRYESIDYGNIYRWGADMQTERHLQNTKEAIDRTIEDKGIMVVTMHSIVTSLGTDEFVCLKDLFIEMIDYVVSKDIKVVTLKEMMETVKFHRNEV